MEFPSLGVEGKIAVVVAASRNIGRAITLGLADAGADVVVASRTVDDLESVAEEIRAKMPGDYGRSKGIAWYYLGGFGIVHNNTSNTDQNRIIKWDSAV